MFKAYTFNVRPTTKAHVMTISPTRKTVFRTLVLPNLVYMAGLGALIVVAKRVEKREIAALKQNATKENN